MLEVREVRKSHGSLQALQGVSFQVQPGELFGLLGPNGAGKSTLISILSGLADASSGQVFLSGQSLTAARRDLRQQIGIAPQDLALYEDLTAAENLYFFGELYGIRGNRLRERVGQVLESVALTDRANQRVGTFSGGMKRRLNLGAAILHEPRLLFLDEPTTGVDPQSRNHIFEAVRQQNAAGLTVIYTSHYMEEVEALCTRVGILDQGRLIACDTLANLLRILGGRIRFRVSQPHSDLADQLGRLSDVRVTHSEGGNFEIACQDVSPALVALTALLNRLGLSLTEIHVDEPNLERVFLHLTGRALRD